MQESTSYILREEKKFSNCTCADGLGSSTDPGAKPSTEPGATSSSTDPGTRPFGVARSFFDPGLLAGVVVVVVLLLAAACIVVPIIWWR